MIAKTYTGIKEPASTDVLWFYPKDDGTYELRKFGDNGWYAVSNSGGSSNSLNSPVTSVALQGDYIIGSTGDFHYNLVVTPKNYLSGYTVSYRLDFNDSGTTIESYNVDGVTLNVASLPETESSFTLSVTIINTDGSQTTTSISIDYKKYVFTSTDNPEVIAALYAANKCGANGITQEEIDAITDITNIFSSNNTDISNIKTFDELQYFTHLTEIGDYAFGGCSKLTHVILPDTVTKIGDYAFSYCGITSIDLGNNITTIGLGTFQGTALVSIVVPASVVNFSRFVFSYCSKLTSAILNNKLIFTDTDNSETKYVHIFDHCTSLVSVTLSDDTEYIGQYFCYYCTSLTSINLANVKYISYEAFYNCTSLSGSIVMNNIKHIGESAFSYCSFNSVTINSSDFSCGARAFSYMSNALQLSINNINDNYPSWITYGNSDNIMTNTVLKSLIIKDCQSQNINFTNKLSQTGDTLTIDIKGKTISAKFYLYTDSNTSVTLTADDITLRTPSFVGYMKSISIKGYSNSYPNTISIQDSATQGIQDPTYNYSLQANKSIDIPALNILVGLNVKTVTLQAPSVSIYSPNATGIVNSLIINNGGDITKKGDLYYGDMILACPTVSITNMNIHSTGTLTNNTMTSLDLSTDSIESQGNYLAIASALTTLSLNYPIIYKPLLTSGQGPVTINNSNFIIYNGLAFLGVKVGPELNLRMATCVDYFQMNPNTSLVTLDLGACPRITSLYGCTNLANIYIYQTAAPRLDTNCFGNGTTTYPYVGSAVTGTKTLYVPANSVGYDTGDWLNVLCNSTKCNFVLSKTL